MIVNKITHGFVIQEYDEESKQCVRQSFVAGDDVEWETRGEEEDVDYEGDVEKFQYQPFDMIQPIGYEDYLRKKYSEACLDDLDFGCLEELAIDRLMIDLEKLSLDDLIDKVKQRHPELIENIDEEQRRDEKRGLYPDREDIAN